MTNVASNSIKSLFIRLRDYFRRKSAIKQALLCQGWTGERKLSVLYDIATQTSILDGDILEIGSAWGRSSVLLGYASSKQIWSIDPHTGGRAFIERGEVQESFEIFKANLARNKLDSRVKILKHTTDEVIAKKLLPDPLRFSMVFIDGLHTAKGVEIDFGLAFERLAPGGIMVFDDYFEETIPDYTEMIDLLALKHGQALVKDEDSRLVYFEKTAG
jgi:predicted O-methyltransferase YrrM